MLSVGLSVADQAIWHRNLSQPHTVKTVVQILDLEHNIIADVSHMLDTSGGQVDGQVVKVEGLKDDLKEINDPQILHTLSLTLLDPRRALGFDSSSPADAAIYLDRMLRVYYCTFDPDLNRWVDTPVFTGPIINMARNDALVTVEAQSKEYLGSTDYDAAATIPAGVKVDMIRDLMRKTGELDKYMDLPVLADKAPKAVVLVRNSKPWAKAYALGESMSRHLFYDGRGVLRMADPNTKPVFTFNGDNVTAFPGATYGTGDLRNGVRVTSGTGSGSKPKYDYTAYAEDSHQNSRKSLGRNGVGRKIIETIDDDAIKSQAAAKTRAETELKDRIRTNSAIPLECFCIPHLELWDLIAIDLPDFYAELRVESFSKPITIGSLMTVGYTARITSPPIGRS